MIEPPRVILLPPYGAAQSGAQAGEVRPGAAGLPVPMVMQVPGVAGREERNGAALSDRARAPRTDSRDGGTAPARAGDRLGGRRGDVLIEDARRGANGGIGSLAFLAQQIFQEAMGSGLHLEPWTQGIGAYRRAGAEPALIGAGPAQFSVAV